jgi:hypothetical protein
MMDIITLGAVVGSSVLSLPAIIFLVATGRSRMNFLDLLLLIPAAIVVGFMIYMSAFAGKGECGSASPGLCFGLGWLVIIGPLPLALILNPIVVLRLWRRRKNAEPVRAHKRDNSQDIE